MADRVTGVKISRKPGREKWGQSSNRNLRFSTPAKRWIKRDKSLALCLPIRRRQWTYYRYTVLSPQLQKLFNSDSCSGGGGPKTTNAAVLACFERAKALLGMSIDFGYCPHPPGPPICWCGKPLPGLILQFAFRYQLALDQCLPIGRSAADRTLAVRTGMRYSAV
jgi:hypothetical protein